MSHHWICAKCTMTADPPLVPSLVHRLTLLVLIVLWGTNLMTWGLMLQEPYALPIRTTMCLLGGAGVSLAVPRMLWMALVTELEAVPVVDLLQLRPQDLLRVRVQDPDVPHLVLGEPALPVPLNLPPTYLRFTDDAS